MPTKPSIPQNLSRKYWSANKTQDSKSNVGDQLDKLNKAFDAIDWKKLILTDKNKDSIVKNFKADRDKEFADVFHYIEKIEKALDKEPDSAAKKELLKSLDVLSKSIVKFALESKKEITTALGTSGKPYKIDWAFDFSGYVAKGRKIKEGQYNLGKNCQLSLSFTLLDIGGKENAYIEALIVDSASTAAQSAAEEIINILDNSSKIFRGLEGEEKIKYDKIFKAQLQPKIDKILQETKVEIDKVVAQKWAECVKNKEEYKMYKIKSAGKVAKGSLEVLSSTAAVAASGAAIASGGGSAAGVVGLVLSARSLAGAILKTSNLIYTLAQSADKFGEKVEKQVQKMNAEFQRDAKTAAWKDLGKETAASFQQLVLDFPFISTSKTISEDCETWQSKTQGLSAGAIKYGRDIPKLLDTMDKIGKELKNSGLKDAKIKKLQKDLTKMEGMLDKMITKTINLSESYQSNITKVKNCIKLMDEISNIRKETLPLMARLVPAAVTFIGSTAEAFVEPAKTIKDAVSLGITLGTNITAFAEEVVSEAKKS